MEFYCYTDFNSSIHKLDQGKDVIAKLRQALAPLSYEGTISVGGWPTNWDDEKLTGKWIISFFPTGDIDDAKVREIRSSILSLLGWTIGHWKRTFNGVSGDFSWETEIPFLVREGDDRLSSLGIVIYTKPPSTCKVTRVEEMVKSVRFISDCSSPSEEEDT